MRKLSGTISSRVPVSSAVPCPSLLGVADGPAARVGVSAGGAALPLIATSPGERSATFGFAIFLSTVLSCFRPIWLTLQLCFRAISGLLRRHGSEVTGGGRRDRGCAGAVGRLATGG